MTVSRRSFSVSLGTAGLAATMLPAFAQDAARSSLRVIAYNIYACKGWPKDRTLAKKAVHKQQMADRAALELSLYDPDIINFSESPSEEITLQIAEKLGMNHVRFPSGGNWPGTLLSRFEIVEDENTPLGYQRPSKLFTRHWGRATIKQPNGRLLIVHSAHLYPGADPTIRLQEIQAMLASMKKDVEAGHSMLLIGDLNHGPDSEEYKLWIYAGWMDTFAEVGSGEGWTIKADSPDRRIDYVMAIGPIASHITESRPLFEGAFRLNPSDEHSFALSDHLPQMALFGKH